jgi:membrane protease YdiL (CAAX protease family)
VLLFHSVLIFLAFWLLGRSTWDEILIGLSVPRLRYFALPFVFAIGAAIPICIGTALLSDHLSGIALNAPIWSIAWVISAFGEEVIFRGILQPRFVTRYGVIRGLVLLSIAFAAWHVPGDFAGGSDLTELAVIVGLFGRLVNSVGLCFVTGWLTLRSGSILPAVTGHILYNVLASLLPSSFAVDVLWIALAYFLFRYIPTGASPLPAEQRASSTSF